MRRISRRALLGSLIAGLAACRRNEVGELTAREAAEIPRDSDGPAPAPSSTPRPLLDADSSFDIRRLDGEAEGLGRSKAVVMIPRWIGPGERLPVLVALHGRAEARRGLDAGANAWLRDYGLARAAARLRAPPLTADDFQGFVTPARLEAINASLAERPFRGLIVVCPYVPDVLDERRRARLDSAAPFGRHLVETLLPRVRREAPAHAEAAATGIDGVSLGGRVALVTGFAHAPRFGAIGALQAAIQRTEVASLVERARRARSENPHLVLRLVTSEGDYFRKAIGVFHEALAAEGLPHEHVVLPGPHDYAFNRGPGAIEMLLFHDRALRGEAISI